MTVNINSPETFASTSPHVECTLTDRHRWPWPTPSFGCCSLPATPAPLCPLYIGVLDVTQTRTRSSSSNTCRNRRLRKPDSRDPQPVIIQTTRHNITYITRYNITYTTWYITYITWYTFHLTDILQKTCIISCYYTYFWTPQQLQMLLLMFFLGLVVVISFSKC